MSSQYMVAVKDRAMDLFMRPFFVPHRQAAIRSFTDEINRVDSEMWKHPDDYDLYYLDVWDESTGLTVDRPDRPELLVRGKDVKTGGVK